MLVLWNVITVSTNLNLSEWFNVFLKIQYWESERTEQITDQEDNINLDNIIFDDNNQPRN